METVDSYVLSYLLNALWQAPLVAAAVWVADILGTRLRMVQRHWLWTAGLVIAVFLPAVSLRAPMALEPPVALEKARIEEGVAVDRQTSSMELKTLPAPPGLAATVGVLYTLWLFWAAGRLLAGWSGVRRIARHARQIPLPDALAEAEEAARAATGVLPTPVLCSTRAAAPLTAGCREPFIVLPEAIFYSRDATMLRAVLGHEMAHIARCDYIRKILMEIIAAPLGFHPAVRFVLRRLDQTREMACDEFVTHTLVPARSYAKYKLDVASAAAMFRSPRHSLGVLDAGILEERIRLLLRPRRTWSGWIAPLFVTAALGSVMALALGLIPRALSIATLASLDGRVFDASGAVVPGARLQLVDNRTGARFECESDFSGGFRFQAIPVGEYTLAVQKRGFRVFRHRRINLGRTLRIHPVLELGVVRETLTVAARIPS